MSSPKPLEGVRVIDLCVVWAGPYATMLLGDLGAEVIKPENPFVFQPMTRGAMARPPQILADTGIAWSGGVPGGKVGARPWDYSPTFVSLYRNKKSFTVDLRTEQGREIFGKVVAQTDVVVENDATETMDGLGITYDWLRNYRDDIIMVRIPAYGSSGPYNQARALGVSAPARLLPTRALSLPALRAAAAPGADVAATPRSAGAGVIAAGHE